MVNLAILGFGTYVRSGLLKALRGSEGYGFRDPAFLLYLVL